jgi:hypothetical protein
VSSRPRAPMGPRRKRTAWQDGQRPKAVITVTEGAPASVTPRGSCAGYLTTYLCTNLAEREGS